LKNVLLVVIDCLRADRLQGVGGARVPTLERLRDEGLSFTQAISGASNTTPSLATILTGRHPYAHGVRQLRSRLGSGVPVLPEIFAAQGYHTVGKVTGPLFEESGIGRGFEDYVWREPDAYLGTDWGDNLMAQLRSQDTPWFMLLHLWELHWPRQAPIAYRLRGLGATLYDQALSALDAELARVLEAIPSDTIVILTGDHGERLDTTYDRSDAIGIATYATRPLWHHFRRWIPRPLGRVLDDLRRSVGLPDELHGRRAGFGLNDYLIRVPLIFWGPGVPRGRRVDLQVRHVDVVPTVLDLVGLPDRPELELSLLTRGDAASRDRVAYAEATDDRLGWIACVREGRWKYVLAPESQPAHQLLFDLVEDPREQTDLSERLPDQALLLRGRLLSMIEGGGQITSGSGLERAPGEEQRVLERLAALGYLEDE
jgi:arylsulfatase A-like enzyme